MMIMRMKCYVTVGAVSIAEPMGPVKTTTTLVTMIVAAAMVQVAPNVTANGNSIPR
jgi:hypothetical protein